MTKPSRFRSAASALRRVISAAAIVAACLLPLGSLHPQTLPESASVLSGRKVVARVQPGYPALLRAARIGGIVKLNATVLPNGTVSKVSIIGGNPILAEEAAKAIRLWKFAPAHVPTNEIVSFNFRVP